MIKLNIGGLRQALEVRNSRFYSIREIAVDSGVSEIVISKLIRNKVIRLDIRMLGKLVHYFQKNGLTVSLGDFFRWEGDELVLNIGSLIAGLDPTPTFNDVAEELGIYIWTVEDLAMGNMRRVTLSRLWPFFQFFGKRGLEINLGDLLSMDTAVSFDEDNDQLPSATPILGDQKKHDLAKMGSAHDAESVPIIQPPILLASNIIALKHLLIAKKGKIYLNQQICQEAEIAPDMVGYLIRGDVASFNLSAMGKLASYFQSEGVVIEVGDFFSWQGKELVSNLGSLMAQLDPIPTSEEIHDETGIFFLGVESLVRGHVERVSFHDLGALWLFFRKRAVDIKLGNLLREKAADFPRVMFIEEQERVRLAQEHKALDIARKMLDIGLDVAQIMNKDFRDEQIKVEALTLAAQSEPIIGPDLPIIGLNVFRLKHLLIAIKDKEYSTKEIAQGTGISWLTIFRFMKSYPKKIKLSTISKLAYYFQHEGLAIELGDFFRWEGEVLGLNIDSLLARLDPTQLIKKVHDETGIPRPRINNLVRGHVKLVYLHDLAALLLFFRKRGLSINLGDLLKEEGVDVLPSVYSLGMEKRVRLAEERKALELSGKMLSLGIDVGQIATVTGLSLEQIKG